MKKQIEKNNKILQNYIKKTSEKINEQGFCEDKQKHNLCERCILKKKCIIK